MTRAHLGRTRRSSAIPPIGQQGFRRKAAQLGNPQRPRPLRQAYWAEHPVHRSHEDFVAMGAVLVVTLLYWDSRSCHARQASQGRAGGSEEVELWRRWAASAAADCSLG